MKFKKSNRFSGNMLFLAITLVCILIAFIIVYAYCKNQSAKQHTYVFTAENLDIPQDGLCLSVTVQADKQWKDAEHHPNIPFGAQYDGVLKNISNFTFKNWGTEIIFSDNIHIDSSWNGNFSANGTNLLFVPSKNTSAVSSHNNITFGAVMYSKKLMSVKRYTLTGYRILRIFDLPAFCMLIFLSAIWLIALILNCIIRFHTARYLKQQELDSKIIKQSMDTFIGFIDAKDSYTKGHSARVAAYAVEIARRMKISHEKMTQLYYITLMHDCGKIGVPDSILKKPGKLTPDEYKVMQAHTTIGDSILVNFTAIPEIRNGARYHHERYDGNGYPDGLKGTSIPMCARIICVADYYDAMSTTRCYRSKLSRDVILQKLSQNAGKQFDPAIVPIMIAMIKDGFTDKVQAENPPFDIALQNVQ